MQIPPPLPPLPDDPWGRVARVVEGWWPLIDATAQAVHLSQALLEAVIHEESGGNPDAFPEHPERDGASFGLMQLLLPTARSVGYTRSARALFEPALNIVLGGLYLAQLVREWGTYKLALVAYNGGPRAAWLAARHLPAGAAGHYSQTVMALYERYRRRNQARTPA